MASLLMGIAAGIAQLLVDFLEIDDALRVGITVVWSVTVACWLLMDFFARSIERKEGGADPGESGEKRDEDDGDLMPYAELQRLTPVKLVVLERDFLVPKAYLRRRERIHASLVGVAVCISLLAVLYISSWWWVVAASVLYLVVAVGTVWAPTLRRRKTDSVQHGAWRSGGEG